MSQFFVNSSSSSDAGLVWSNQSGSFSPTKNNGYFITGTSTATLPASPSTGDTISFNVVTSQILTIQTSGTQQIRLGNVISTAGGTLINTLIGDSITLIYRSGDNDWHANAGTIGSWGAS